VSKVEVVDTRTRWLVYLFAVLYAGAFASAAAVNYLLYRAPRFDLGNMVQVVWSTAHGDLLRMSDPSGADISRLGAHFDPFLALLVPLWWIWSSPLVLVAAQAIAVSSGALPVYWLGRKHLDHNGFAAVFAIAYLLYPATQFNAFTPIGVHAVSFAVPLLLYAIWFLDEDRLVVFAILAGVAATTKEEIGAAVAALGIWHAVRRGRRLFGAVVFACGSAISLAAIFIVIPHYSTSGTSPFAGRYERVGGTAGGVAKTAFTDPAALIHQVTTWHKLLFLVLVFGPFLGLWALEPVLLVGALPDLTINLLSSKPEQTTVFYQYTAGIIPFVVAASIFGAERMRRRRHSPTTLLAVTCCVALVSPLVYTITTVTSRSDLDIRATREALRTVPAGIPVSASQTLGAYVSTRRVVAVFPNIRRADWVLVGPVASGEDNPAAV
jgi:uncharacterized membrane protein